MARPRTRSMLSFTGKTRRSSSGSLPKVDAAETAQEKARYKINTKADPSKAMNEAQPSSQAVTSDTTLESIRKLEHRDADGNVITDPDRSNPTRPRMERPLDTIRSFEAAIDGSYSRRSSFRADSAVQTNAQNRRSNYFQGHQSQQRASADVGSYYGNRMSASRGDVYADSTVSPSSNYYAGRRFGPRNNSDPALYGHSRNNGVSPLHGHQQSYDTVATASNGSHATDQWGNSTDPSSENSSLDKLQPGPKTDLSEYGFNGFGGAPQFQGPILEEHGQGAPVYGQPGYGQSQPVNETGRSHQGGRTPQVPPHTAPAVPSKGGPPKPPIRLGATVGSRPPPAAENNEKRKSWIKRRFSKG